MGYTIIVAVSNDYVIGVNGGLPWKLPTDLKFFKKTTDGHTIVMGRKTYESLPNGALPNRTNVVLSRDETFKIDDGVVIFDISDLPKSDEEIFIIGGGTIYEQCIPLVNKIYLTKVDVDIDDIFATRLYGFIPSEWELVQEIGSYAEFGVNYTISEYKRK